MPLRLEEQVRQLLVRGASDDLGRRQEDERAVELRAPLGEQQVVEVGERDDQRDAVLADERRSAGT